MNDGELMLKMLKAAMAMTGGDKDHATAALTDAACMAAIEAGLSEAAINARVATSYLTLTEAHKAVESGNWRTN